MSADDADDGGPAFPAQEMVSAAPLSIQQENRMARGMSLRDYFAAKAIPLIVRTADLDNAGTPEMAAACYEFADELLHERERPLVVRINDRIAADNANARASRYEQLLRAVCAAADKGDVGQTDELREALQQANAHLADDEIPF